MERDKRYDSYLVRIPFPNWIVEADEHRRPGYDITSIYPTCNFSFGVGENYWEFEYIQIEAETSHGKLNIPIPTSVRGLKLWFQKKMGGGTQNPLVLALSGNVINTVNLSNGVYFDYSGNGFAEASGSVGPGEGQLCIDRNGNGTIDNGSELFGSLTPLPDGQLATSGFQALAALDSNHDGEIDPQDPAFSQLSVWVDSDTDGVTQPGELFTLPQLGIDSIDLNWTTLNTTDSQGNIEICSGTFQKTDGSTGLIADYAFQIQPYNTIPTEILPVPDDIAALPDVPASGTVYDLQQAMVRDTSGHARARITNSGC